MLFLFFCDHDLTAVIDRQARSQALQLIFFFLHVYEAVVPVKACFREPLTCASAV